MRAASGSTAFWQPLASRPAHPVARRIVGCPCFGDTRRDPAVDAICSTRDAARFNTTPATLQTGIASRITQHSPASAALRARRHPSGCAT
jgi:hypothetical protein